MTSPLDVRPRTLVIFVPLNAAKKIILLLWLLIMASFGNVSALTPGAAETCVWQKSFAALETRPVEPQQTAGGRQENGNAAYDFASASLLAAETTAADSQYFISSGVRRSLSSLQNGASDIPATIVQSGQADVQTTLRLDQLFSPKFEVPADSRFLNIQPPIRVPIEVQPLGIPGQPFSIPLNQVKIVPP